ncbi:MAG: outer membrane beta-barrel protein [Ekhidna sp.]
MRIVLLILSVFMVCTVGAQSKTYVGIKGGGQASSAFINHTIFRNNMNTTFKSGIHSGLLVKHFAKKRDIFLNAGIQFGINYIQKGWKQKFITDIPNYSVQMNYLEIPVEAIGYFGNKNKFFVTAGLYFETLLNTKKSAEPTETERGGSAVDFYTYESSRDRKAGYGGRASAGTFRDFSFGSIHLEGFFTYSISNFIDAGNLTDETPDISNLWTVGGSIAYLIPFGKLKMTK